RQGAEFAGGRRRFLHTGAKRAVREWQGQTQLLVSNRVGGFSRPRHKNVFLAEADGLRERRLRVEERLGHADRAGKHPQDLQRRFCPAHETVEIRGRESSREAIPIRAIGVVKSTPTAPPDGSQFPLEHSSRVMKGSGL